MQPAFVDTNIFLRHLLDDHPVQSPRCHLLIAQMERGDFTGWTTPLVIAEIIFVLSNAKTYAVPRTTLSQIVLPLVKLTNLKIERKSLYTRVFELFVAHPIDFIDAYHAAVVETLADTTVVSYDQHFDRLSSVVRHEP